MIIKIVCSCGKEREPIIYVREGGEVIALIEAECPHCVSYSDKIDKLNKELGDDFKRFFSFKWEKEE